MSFVSDYLEHTKLYESPTSFWKWSAYAAVSAVMRDQVWRQEGDTKLFASIYTLLLADSGIHRKGKPVEICEKLVQRVGNTKVINGRSSIQAILQELSMTETNQKTGRLLKGGAAIFFAPEMAAAIVSDPAAIGILTDIYDYRDDYSRRLVSGRTKIEKVVFSMLAGSNEVLLKSVYTSSAVQGGLLARTFIISADEFRPSNSLMDIPDLSKSFESLVEKLKSIGQIQGALNVTLKGKEEYEHWYGPYRNSLQNKGDKSGITSRIHAGVKKLAFILALNDLTLEVDKCHIEQAIDECMRLLPNYLGFIMSSGKAVTSEASAMILEDLLAAKGNQISRKLILQKHFMDFDSEMLEKVVVTLEQAGLISSTFADGGVSYKLTEKCLEVMKDASK